MPAGYTRSGGIDLKNNKRLAIILNIVAVIITIFVFFLLSGIAALVRPELNELSDSITVGVVLLVLILMVITFVIHELIHGFFFWVFTRNKPIFALHLLYAYAGAPEWYIPVRQYAIISISPLVIIDLVGLLLMLLSPQSWVVIIIFLIAMNTGGAMGDLLVFVRLFKTTSTSLANDTGDAVTFYERATSIIP